MHKLGESGLCFSWLSFPRVVFQVWLSDTRVGRCRDLQGVREEQGHSLPMAGDGDRRHNSRRGAGAELPTRAL